MNVGILDIFRKLGCGRRRIFSSGAYKHIPETLELPLDESTIVQIKGLYELRFDVDLNPNPSDDEWKEYCRKKALDEKGSAMFAIADYSSAIVAYAELFQDRPSAIFNIITILIVWGKYSLAFKTLNWLRASAMYLQSQPEWFRETVDKYSENLNTFIGKINDEIVYDWLRTSAPEICPKNIGAYRRMKNANTSNFQKIVGTAAENGIDVKPNLSFMEAKANETEKTFRLSESWALREYPLEFIDRERISISHITPEIMSQFNGCPFYMNLPFEKQLSGHPFVYMDLDAKNQEIAKNHFCILNTAMDSAKYIYTDLITCPRIKEDQIKFSRYSDRYGYTGAIFQPFELSGKRSERGMYSKVPIRLSFCSDLSLRSKDSAYRRPKYEVHGEIYYQDNGEIHHGFASFLSRNTLWVVKFANRDGVCTVTNVEQTFLPPSHL